MSTLTKITEAVTGNVITAAVWNDEWDQLLADYNGGITNANISGSAAIAASKLNLSSATLNDPVVYGGRHPFTSATSTGTYEFDLDDSNHFYITLNANTVLSITGGGTGQIFIAHFLQGSGGSKLVTWFSGIAWENGGTTPTLTTTESYLDTFAFAKTTNGYIGYIVGQNIDGSSL